MEIEAKNETLYQRVLGNDFERLPSILQQFHSQEGSTYATGNLVIKSADNRAGKVVARLLGLPRPSDNTSVRLEVFSDGVAEHWHRRFGEQRIESLQWEEQGFLIEQIGLLRFVFEVRASERGLEFEFRGNRLLSCPVPKILSLRVDATAMVQNKMDDRWNIEVKFHSPLLGTLTTYSGTIGPIN